MAIHKHRRELVELAVENDIDETLKRYRKSINPRKHKPKIQKTNYKKRLNGVDI